MPNTNLHTSHSPHHNVNVTSRLRPRCHHPRRHPHHCHPCHHFVAIPFAVPVLSAIKRQEQRECIGQTSFLEKWLIIIQQLIVINKGQLRSFEEAAVQVDATGMHRHCMAECMASLTEAKFLCYLGRPPSIPGNEKSGGMHLDNPHNTTWLHLSMLIDIQTPLID
jgi:hypothetical protein